MHSAGCRMRRASTSCTTCRSGLRLGFSSLCCNISDCCIQRGAAREGLLFPAPPACRGYA
jgi:hypothetical protein